SLAATRVISRVVQRFQLQLPVKSMFEAATVAEMASVIENSHANTPDNENLSLLLTELESLSEEQAQELIDQGKAGQRRQK
ncbi:MAG: phosphopantetheine-binding protein, partial [Candidatus Binatia bacterium]